MKTVLERYVAQEIAKKYSDYPVEVNEEQDRCIVLMYDVPVSILNNVKKYITKVLQNRLDKHKIYTVLQPSIKTPDTTEQYYWHKRVDPRCFPDLDDPPIRLADLNDLIREENIDKYIVEIHSLLEKISKISEQLRNKKKK